MNPETAQRDRKAQEIFGQSLELSEPAARAGFLAGACGDDALLRQRVEALLASHVEDNFLEKPPGDLESKVMSAAPATENPGHLIGRYKLLEKLGEGGFGVVFMAEQREPVKRRVALKIIKPGMDSRQVIARFEAERQALAMMDHPHIAKFLDAGVTESLELGSSGRESTQTSPIGSQSRLTSAATTGAGRPYFVMELVRGIRITEYCAQKTLSTRQRLDLFIAVCHAVQHAHQKGIIHRDLKPSNILVAENDGVPVPKIIDFGIAKATEQKLTDKTLFTQFAAFLGTPAYMSPEQAAMTSLDIDTRSDIYSLGVLLYELLTGTTPFDAQELLQAGFDEMRRIIRETEPERPSTRLTSLLGRRGERAIEGGRALGLRRQDAAFPSPHESPNAPSHPPCSQSGVMTPQSTPNACALHEPLSELVAADVRRLHSKSEIGNRKSKIEQDLDWIVMKCLEKDRTRRYETANGLAADLQRHLSNEPIVARPPSRIYQFQKLARRNRVAFAAAAVVMVAIMAGLTLATWAFVRERAARRQTDIEAAKSQQVAKFLKEMIRGVEPSVALGRDVTVLREIADQTLQRMTQEQSVPPEIELQLSATLGGVYHHLGDYKKAEVMHRETLSKMRKLLGSEHPEVADLMRDFVCVLEDRNKHKESEALGRQALALSLKLHGPEHPDVARSLELIARSLSNQKKFSESEALLRQSLDMNRKVQGPEHRDVAMGLSWLAEILDDQGRIEEAEAVFQQALSMMKKARSNVHPDVARLLRLFAEFQEKHGKSLEAEGLYRELLPIEKKLLGNETKGVANTLNNLGTAIHNSGRSAEAEPYLREALALYKRRGDEGKESARSMYNLGITSRELKRLPEAESMFRDALVLRRKFLQPNDPDLELTLRYLGRALADQEEFAEAEVVFSERLSLVRKNAPGDPEQLDSSLNDLAETRFRQKKYAEAEPLYRELNQNRSSRLPPAHDDVWSAKASLARLLADWTWAERTDESEVRNPKSELAERAREAERLLSECLAHRLAGTNAANWRTSDLRSRLGAAILSVAVTDPELSPAAREGKFTEAEALLRAGNEGLQQRQSDGKYQRDALERLIRLYEAWNKPDRAAEWRSKLERFDQPEAETESASAREARP